MTFVILVVKEELVDHRTSRYHEGHVRLFKAMVKGHPYSRRDLVALLGGGEESEKIVRSFIKSPSTKYSRLKRVGNNKGTKYVFHKAKGVPKLRFMTRLGVHIEDDLSIKVLPVSCPMMGCIEVLKGGGITHECEYYLGHQHQTDKIFVDDKVTMTDMTFRCKNVTERERNYLELKYDLPQCVYGGN